MQFNSYLCNTLPYLTIAAFTAAAAFIDMMLSAKHSQTFGMPRGARV